MLKIMGCEVIIHYHNKGVCFRQDKLVDNWMYRQFFKNLKVILLSNCLYVDIQKYVKKEDVVICPNGIPRTNSGNITRNNVVPHLLFLSNLLISKGVYVLLEACKILKDKGLSFYCDIVGAESKEISSDIFQYEVSKRGLHGIVEYHGRKYGAEKDGYLRSADIFVFPSFYDNECFPLVLLEAMQYQLPIVTTDEGGIPDIIQDGINGFVCERKNTQSLATAIEKILLSPELRVQMGKRGFEIYQQKFTLKKFESNFCKCLKQSMK